MITLSELAPMEKLRLMDLVEAAGVDVSDWANCARGPNYAASNPRYCYEWSFLQPGRVLALTVWHDDMRQDQDGTIFSANNMRQVARKPDTPSAFQRRARQYDEHLTTAKAGSLPIRVIICSGAKRGVHLPRSEASEIKKRRLDTNKWFIKTYNHASGDYVLQRGGQ